jgi:hypothetical protein
LQKFPLGGGYTAEQIFEFLDVAGVEYAVAIRAAFTLSPWILIASQPTSAQSSIHRIAPWPKNILEHCVQSHWKDAPSLAVWAETSISVPAKPDRIYAKCDEWIRLAAT